MKKNSIKNPRLNSEFQKELSIIVREEIKDPRIHSLTSITGVEVTPDLKFAKAFVSVLGNEKDKEDTMKGLKSAASFVRSLVAKRMNLRNTPDISFVLDTSIEYGVEMSKKISEVINNDDEGDE